MINDDCLNLRESFFPLSQYRTYFNFLVEKWYLEKTDVSLSEQDSHKRLPKFVTRGIPVEDGYATTPDDNVDSKMNI